MVVKKPSRRAATVIETMEQILEILKDRNQHEFLEALLRNAALETLAKDEVQEDVPKWYVELFVALTKLYDQGYLDSTKNSELGR
jgi:16S rRNA C967 or C1407 C5-methylase (RsmB/RsmF family)